ncbi:hypothetical protein BIV57_11880 [Mangrovactinospora gilvigrisea]|uniref:Uncharacterized protein n=1 Tax=Mangrovactinospora gilvigrisea TaxID=1428644 RepID=A0A1J7BF15_9ACTN|nr:hypothetical protein [Mangrovactinospora gilvigrisea]OIV37275.1 hypothetical protein BIV57_11880 [Mangrovactinospora gilvigrisea]
MAAFAVVVALPVGKPREWYVKVARSRKASAIAEYMINNGLGYDADEVTDSQIRHAAELAGEHEPSAITCALVRERLGALEG